MSSTRTRIFTGDPADDMEIAKQLIASYPNVNVGELIEIAIDETQALSARVAAIYTLGFTDQHGRSKTILARLINDPSEAPEIKDHAQEALGYLTPHHDLV